MAGNSKYAVGVLGGMGPEATALFLSRVISLTHAADDSDHIPLLIDNNTQVPSRIKAIIEKTGESPGPTLANMAKKLEADGVKALAMPCNTAHWYAKDIVKAVDIPLLNMIELSLEAVSNLSLTHRRVGILGSPAVKITGLFGDIFSRESIDCVYPKNQEKMLAAIKGVKENKEDENARKVLMAAADELVLEGVDALLIACSEFSIISDCLPSDTQCIDTIDVLARAVIKFSNGGD